MHNTYINNDGHIDKYVTLLTSDIYYMNTDGNRML